MLYTDQTRIGALALHLVGNKAKDEPLLVSPALSDQVDDEGLMRTLVAYFAGGFRTEELYNLHHETELACNEVWSFVGRIFDDPADFYGNSVKLARHLYECGTHPQIKGGEFYVVYLSDCSLGGERTDAVGLFKTENRVTFLDVAERGGALHIDALQGIRVDRLDKGCLIFNRERGEGFVACVVDNTNRTEARYWTDDFLHLRQRQDDYHHTHNAMAMCRSYVTKRLPEEFAVSKADQAELLNETMRYFREQEHFSMEEFAGQVIRQQEVAESFSRFRDDYEQERDIRIDDGFAISDSAVRRQARAYRSVIKLDRNFHIYVHGNRSLMEQGEDERGKYYKIYYESEE